MPGRLEGKPATQGWTPPGRVEQLTAKLPRTRYPELSRRRAAHWVRSRDLRKPFPADNLTLLLPVDTIDEGGTTARNHPSLPRRAIGQRATLLVGLESGSCTRQAVADPGQSLQAVWRGWANRVESQRWNLSEAFAFKNLGTESQITYCRRNPREGNVLRIKRWWLQRETIRNEQATQATVME